MQMFFREASFRSVRIMLSGMIFFGLAGCSGKSGEAVVIEKEYIAAAEIRATPSAAPGNSVTPPVPAAASEASDNAGTTRELKPTEIVVDGYVMEKDVRGTSKDPRVLTHEQWLVRVELASGGRKIHVHADRKQFEKLKPGNHVEITYREGKYTGTVWSAEIK